MIQKNEACPPLRGKVKTGNPFYTLIEQAYRVFKQAPTDLGVCECCMCPDIRKKFFKHRQDRLPLNYINDWFFAAAETPLDKNSWRFLLPRILEILASGEDPSTTAIEVSLNRFETGQEKNWTNKEWAILDQFQKRLLFHNDIRADDCLDDVICMFANAGWPIKTLFAQIREWPTEKLVTRLWKDWCHSPHPEIWTTTFWNEERIPREFYTSEEMLEKVTDYALDNKTSANLSKKAMVIADLMMSHSN